MSDFWVHSKSWHRPSLGGGGGGGGRGDGGRGGKPDAATVPFTVRGGFGGGGGGGGGGGSGVTNSWKSHERQFGWRSMQSSAQPVALVASRLASTCPIPFSGRPTPRSTTMATCVRFSACVSERGSSGGGSSGIAAVVEGTARRRVAAAATTTR